MNSSPGHSQLSDPARIFLYVTAVLGILILLPLCDYQPFIAQGDHGRDLYAFLRVAHGAVPYRDFSWLFGPLMPYYYAVVMKCFGESMQAVLLGQNILILLTGLVIYLSGVRYVSPGFSCLCALWYWIFRNIEFGYTYDHSGAILAVVVVVYFLLRYIERPSRRYILAGFAAIFLLALIRYSIAGAALVGFVLTLLLTDVVNREPLLWSRIRWYVYGSLACVILTVSVYWIFLHGLPLYAIWESFPVTQAQRTDHALPLSILICLPFKYVLGKFWLHGHEWAGSAVIVACCLGTLAFLFDRRYPVKKRSQVALCLGGLLALMLLMLFEFLSSGVTDRLQWIFPIATMALFFLFEYAARFLQKPVYRIVIAVILLGLCTFVYYRMTRVVLACHAPRHLLQVGETRVYSLQSADWIDTVQRTSRFIEQNVPTGEKLMTLPMDTLYNFLTKRDQPTRQWIFFEHTIIPREQEEAVISDLEKAQVNWVLISNRGFSSEKGFGFFGQSYCPFLGRYIQDNFTPVATFGPWCSVPGWNANHSVMLLKRNAHLDGARAIEGLTSKGLFSYSMGGLCQ